MHLIINMHYHINLLAGLSELGSCKSVSRKWESQVIANLMGDWQKKGNRGDQNGK